MRIVTTRLYFLVLVAPAMVFALQNVMRKFWDMLLSSLVKLEPQALHHPLWVVSVGAFLFSGSIYMATYWLPERVTPLKYFLRFWCFSVAFVAVALLFLSDSLQWNALDFARYMQQTSFYSSWGMLIMLGFGYYILPFSFMQKFGVSVLAVGHNLLTSLLLTWLCLMIPQGLGPILYPLFCLAFGPFLHFAWFVGFYSWALSWRRL